MERSCLVTNQLSLALSRVASPPPIEIVRIGKVFQAMLWSGRRDFAEIAGGAEVSDVCAALFTLSAQPCVIDRICVNS